MDTSFLSTRYGVMVISIVMVGILFLVTFLIVQFRKHGIQIKGMSFGMSEYNLTNAIPRIDKRTQLALIALITELQNTFRASLDVKSLASHKQDQRVLKMLLANMMTIPLLSAVHRNHLVRQLAGVCKKNTWLAHIREEMTKQFNVMRDYCDIDEHYDCDLMVGQMVSIIETSFIHRVVAILLDAVYEKRTIYLRMQESAKQRTLINKCDNYIAGLEEL